mgnify:CR=1 FL=1
MNYSIFSMLSKIGIFEVVVVALATRPPKGLRQNQELQDLQVFREKLIQIKLLQMQEAVSMPTEVLDQVS